MDLHLSFSTALGLTGAALAFGSDLMKRMMPLRALALAANLCLIPYYAVALGSHIESQLPNLILQCMLMPVNAYRLWDLHRLVRSIESASDDTPITEWLIPHMRRKLFKAGATLFEKGDVADELIYIASGTVRLPEIGVTRGPGELMGEIGLFSQDRKRTATVVCETDCVLYRMTDRTIHLLYFQNPKLGFYLIRLIVQRLLRDLNKEAQTVER